jgi:hypothetical protein
MYSGKIAVPPGGGGIVLYINDMIINYAITPVCFNVRNRFLLIVVLISKNSNEHNFFVCNTFFFAPTRT